MRQPTPPATRNPSHSVPADQTGSPLCVACNTRLAGAYCWNCGEKRLGEHDYSLYQFLKHALEACTHFDANIFRGLASLVTRPGFLTSEYLAGRRKSHMGPLQLFLIINVIYFLLQPLIGWNNLTTSLATHLNDEFYSPVARRVADAVMAKSRLTLTDFEARFDRTSLTHAKSLVILMVPMFALALALFYRKAERYYVEHLIFSLHFFAFWLLMTSAVLFLTNLVIEASFARRLPFQWQAIEYTSNAVQVLLYIWYFRRACRKVYHEPSGVTFVKAAGLGVSVIYVLKAYRMILFFTTLYSL
jgi:hypothetical protein